ncbi:AAA family ATPase [Microbacterium sp. zg.Y625]|uniref:AAA family ATPase n=1 Tax=Microbacterium jiangjiandongii TaxID=3049071 RepID=UPI00214C9A44|nr:MULTISPECIES: AAA family ATPase [unclassified Microbacterium]MCR2792376.1 AAA family ATPase [Microbacterium sp. zg.Y625]MCR2816864.1 AAA family ATPase [Microbacterium sp. zg.Y843]WIM26374.1 AAA family ATPase [Microbacterium sp. zg-Y625]
MARLLITGMSGAGKSTLLSELSRRGHHTVDTDYEDWTDHDGGPWNASRMTALLESHRDVVVAGTAENQATFYDRFDHVILLSAPVDVLLERVTLRTNNPYGHSPEQRHEIRRYVAEVEPMLRRGADLELDGLRPVSDLADAVESLMTEVC